MQHEQSQKVCSRRNTSIRVCIEHFTSQERLHSNKVQTYNKGILKMKINFTFYTPVINIMLTF
jgi:hypothetical protein